MLPFLIQACVLWFSLFFSNYLLVFHYFNKHEDNFRNSKIVEFVILTHARSVGFWWDPIYEIFSLIDWLLYLIILHLCTNLVSYDNAQLVIKVRLEPNCVYWFIYYHACLAFTHLITVRYPCLINQLSYSFHLISRDSFLRT